MLDVMDRTQRDLIPVFTLSSDVQSGAETETTYLIDLRSQEGQDNWQYGFQYPALGTRGYKKSQGRSPRVICSHMEINIPNAVH
ncbi:unnamed protein product [Pieris macdunnoughi]|uniref:Uncharacterized protein n=1 Tax=Pieris macdunnoughi TaxID=345717 RepID=A0A821WQU3_9NEOP|nr:unnamed protein product [Pieris macdunnoughi]